MVVRRDGVKRRRQSKILASVRGNTLLAASSQILASGAATLLRKVAVQALPSSKCC
jgi:hypothetical protein